MAYDTTPPAGPMQVRSEDFTRMVSAMFDTRDHAEKARQDLVAAGLPDDAIVIASAETDAAAPVDPGPPQKEGFWETLKELFMPDEDRFAFAEGIRRGGFTISVKTDTATHDRVLDILDRDGAVDLDEREQSWRSEGWSGYTASDPIADGRSIEPGSVVLPEDAALPTEEPAYALPSSATAGFAASIADHFPVDAAPDVESPGALPEAERVATPDVAYPSSTPRLPAAATLGTADPAGAAIRDISHGRARVRAYLPNPPPDGAVADRR